jgi:hypothetical protein
MTTAPLPPSAGIFRRLGTAPSFVNRGEDGGGTGLAREGEATGVRAAGAPGSCGSAEERWRVTPTWDVDEGGRRAAQDDGRREGIWCVGPTKLMEGALN